MQVPVVGETTSPNYFKEILVFLYPHFGNAQYYSLDTILPHLKDLKNPEKDEVKSFIGTMGATPDGLINSMNKGTEYTTKTVLSLSIKGFEFCQKHKEYLGIS
jgi:hypothetical protein